MTTKKCFVYCGPAKCDCQTRSREIARSLRAWAPLVAAGYEVPAASKAMLEAATILELGETLQSSTNSNITLR